jgi:hypothetical protein
VWLLWIDQGKAIVKHNRRDAFPTLVVVLTGEDQHC